jgi:hypothetical protein
MGTWRAFEIEQPALAEAARTRFDRSRHKLLATVRVDGAPRISGVELTFAHDELWLGMMPNSRKGQDLRRDPRLALHSGSADPDDADPSAWLGDAKMTGRAIETTDPDGLARFGATQAQMPPGRFELFRVDLQEVTVIRMGDPPDHLVIETWHEGRGVWRIERR